MINQELKDSTFKSRHIGPRKADEVSMLQYLGYQSSEEFISSVIPNEIFDSEHQCVSFLNLDGCDQSEALQKIKMLINF